jgi:hypothetical protein
VIDPSYFGSRDAARFVLASDQATLTVPGVAPIAG